MLNLATSDFLPPTSSPTISSLSSSDFDSESTGSFFHDRSTTLGTLMGVTFPSIAFRAPSQHRRETYPVASGIGGGSRRRRERQVADDEDDRDLQDGEERCRRRSWLRKRRRRWWWGLCRDDACGEDRGSGVGGGRRKSSSASLAEFLDVERRFGEALYGGGGGGGDGDGDGDGGGEEIVEATRPGDRVLFADGRVLPPGDRGSEDAESTALCGGGFRFPGYLSGICNRGVG